MSIQDHPAPPRQTKSGNYWTTTGLTKDAREAIDQLRVELTKKHHRLFSISEAIIQLAVDMGVRTPEQLTGYGTPVRRKVG